MFLGRYLQMSDNQSSLLEASRVQTEHGFASAMIVMAKFCFWGHPSGKGINYPRLELHKIINT